MRIYSSSNNRKGFIILIDSNYIHSWRYFLFKFRGGEFIENWFYEQNYLVYFAVSLTGTFSILFISKLLRSFLSYIGEHTLLLLMIHPYIIRILKIFNTNTLNTLVLFIITLVISLILIGILSRFFPILEGKKQIIK